MRGPVGGGTANFVQIAFIHMWEFALVAYVRKDDYNHLSN